MIIYHGLILVLPLRQLVDDLICHIVISSVGQSQNPLKLAQDVLVLKDVTKILIAVNVTVLMKAKYSIESLKYIA